jgi:hypothetical protein
MSAKGLVKLINEMTPKQLELLGCGEHGCGFYSPPALNVLVRPNRVGHEDCSNYMTFNRRESTGLTPYVVCFIKLKAYETGKGRGSL